LICCRTCKQTASTTKDDHWREKEELCLERAEEHKLREEDHIAREEERKEEEHLYSQWECVRLISSS